MYPSTACPQTEEPRAWGEQPDLGQPGLQGELSAGGSQRLVALGNVRDLVSLSGTDRQRSSLYFLMGLCHCTPGV